MNDTQIWLIIVALGVGTFAVRFSFLGVIGDRPLPPFALKLLRYTPVAVLPGIVAPLILWPEATNGAVDPARLIAAFVTLGLGVITRNMILAILGGGITLFALLWVLG
ncbi:MAG: AzlD domain-containing protein [Maritimibacter sp.]